MSLEHLRDDDAPWVHLLVLESHSTRNRLGWLLYNAVAFQHIELPALSDFEVNILSYVMHFEHSVVNHSQVQPIFRVVGDGALLSRQHGYFLIKSQDPGCYQKARHNPCIGKLVLPQYRETACEVHTREDSPGSHQVLLASSISTEVAGSLGCVGQRRETCQSLKKLRLGLWSLYIFPSCYFFFWCMAWSHSRKG